LRPQAQIKFECLFRRPASSGRSARGSSCALSFNHLMQYVKYIRIVFKGKLNVMEAVAVPQRLEELKGSLIPIDRIKHPVIQHGKNSAGTFGYLIRQIVCDVRFHDPHDCQLLSSEAVFSSD
jgi:hypothetical protein